MREALGGGWGAVRKDKGGDKAWHSQASPPAPQAPERSSSWAALMLVSPHWAWRVCKEKRAR